MSWHAASKENYEISEIHPRREPPNGIGQHTVARVHPMVPEVSVFSHYSNPESRQPLRPVNEAPSKSRLRNAEKSRTEDSLCRTVPIKKPPRPEMPPVRLDFKPSDISKFVSDSEPSMMSQCPKPSQNLDKEKSLLKNPEDLFKVLNWQNEQLMRLQQQVDQLITWQNQQSSELSKSSVTQPSPRTSVTQPSTPNLTNFSPKLMVDSSTQMSAPSSPQKNYRESRNFQEISILRSEQELEKSLEPSMIQPSSLPLGASAGKFASPVQKPNFAQETIENFGEDEIVCQDVEPFENIEELYANFRNVNVTEYPDNDKMGKNVNIPKEESCIEVQRLKDLGVSFISKEDLYPNRKDEPKKADFDPSLWYPQAVDPFQNPTVNTTTDYSLMINSAALKYLNDAQLTQVAQKSPQNASTLEPANVTRYGLPEGTMSVSTREYFLKNDLMRHEQK